MKTRICLAALSLALWSAPPLPAQKTLAITTSAIDEPTMERTVANVDTSATKGLAWRWTAETRRDVGQCFQVGSAFEAKELALQVCSGMAKARAEAPFRFRLFRSASGLTLGALVAEGTGKLPGADQKLKSGTWLLLKFDPVPLEPGRYAFLLEFTDGPQEGQGVVLMVGNTVNRAESGFISTNDDPAKYQPSASFNFILSGGGAQAQAADSARELLVDQRGGAPFKTIADAAQAARPGDTIRLAKGSGPYRELLFIRQSGSEGRSITFDGAGETVTGFEPLKGFRQEGGKWVCDLQPILTALKGVQGFSYQDGAWKNDTFPQALPTVLTYHGERLLQEAKSGQFTKYAKLGEDGHTLVLDEGVSPEGWEIAVRPFVVRVLNASHQTYRNVRASGSLNDGFNLHGAGQDLVFENIEGFHNLDEGFSGHDTIHCRIEKGRFWGNDNGLYGSQEELTASDVDIHDNLGYGFGISAGKAQLAHSRVWGNGMCQVVQSTGTVVYEDVEVYEQMPAERTWITVQESRKQAKPEISQMGTQAIVQTAFNQLPAAAPANP